MNLNLLLTVSSNLPHTIEWNTNVAIVMIFCNIFAIIIGRFAIKNAGKGPDLPINKPQVWQNFGLAELLATLSFGHILGAGLILGLSNAGVL
jgi:photosystem I subunit 10